MNKQNFTLDEIENQLELSKKQNFSFFALIAGFVRLVMQILTIPAIIYLVFAFILGVAHVEHSNMLPNFAEGDYVVFNRLENNYSFGDVIVAQDLDNQTFILKRVIGVPGDTVEITDDQQILVNGKTIRESWQSIGKLTQEHSTLPFTLNQDEYFVLGDNRDSVSDSRSPKTGSIHKDSILGIVVYRFKMSK